MFAQASGWLDALRAVAEEPNVIARRRLIIFPQVGVARFRADFMVVCADVRDIGRSTLLSRFAFFVECDGKIGHAETIEQIVAESRQGTIDSNRNWDAGPPVQRRRGHVPAARGARRHCCSR